MAKFLGLLDFLPFSKPSNMSTVRHRVSECYNEKELLLMGMSSRYWWDLVNVRDAIACVYIIIFFLEYAQVYSMHASF